MARQPLLRQVMVILAAILAALVLGHGLPIGGAGAPVASAQQGRQVTLTGVLSIVYGDRPNGVTLTRAFLAEGGNPARTRELILDDAAVAGAGGYVALRGRTVTITGVDAGGGAPITVSSLRVGAAPSAAPSVGAVGQAPISGSYPYVNLLCRFSDIATQPVTPAYIDNLVSGPSSPSLDHFWREQSYNLINLGGSSTPPQWFTLPQPRGTYITGSPGNEVADLDRLFNDCTAAANPQVNFAAFYGINLIFNANLDGFAWGGTKFATLDGVTRAWPTTWDPPWAYQNQGPLAHEIGHAFGLPHSTRYGLPVNQYGSNWDVMSYLWGYSTFNATYGNVAMHTIAYHKDLLGFFTAAQKYTHTGGSQQITLEQTALPGSTTTYRMAKIPIGGSSTRFYTVEARRITGYDSGLPQHAIVIHDVSTTRAEPAWIMSKPGGIDPGGISSAWGVGDTFTDSTNNISITVNATSGTTFTVTISNASTPTIPSAPTGLMAGTVTGTTAQISWTDTAGNETHFVWLYTPSHTTSWTSGTVAANGTTTTLTGLRPGWSYYVYVAACNAAGCSPPTPPLTLTTPGSVPTAPTNLRAGTITDTSIEALWQDTATTESFFQLAWSPTAAPAWQAVGVAENATRHTLTGLTPNTSYYVYVRACNAVGCSAWSNSLTATAATPPLAPTDLRAEGVTSTSALVRWTDGATNETAYVVLYSPAAVVSWGYAVLGANATSHTLTGLTPATSYYVYVAACNAAACTLGSPLPLTTAGGGGARSGAGGGASGAGRPAGAGGGAGGGGAVPVPPVVTPALVDDGSGSGSGSGGTGAGASSPPLPPPNLPPPRPAAAPVLPGMPPGVSPGMPPPPRGERLPDAGR